MDCLPGDVLAAVFRFSPPRMYSRLQRVCRAWAALLAEDAWWRQLWPFPNSAHMDSPLLQAKGGYRRAVSLWLVNQARLQRLDNATALPSRYVSCPQVRLRFIGPCESGKTSLISSFVEARFSEEYDPTFGEDLYMKLVTNSGMPYAVQILDTSGNPDLAVGDDKSDVTVLVFDATNAASATEALATGRRLKSASPLIVVGSRADDITEAEERRARSPFRGLLVADKLRAPYMECSAKQSPSSVAVLHPRWKHRQIPRQTVARPSNRQFTILFAH
eukprot:TRINITY_DN15109_c0_g1_i2.p1 TRINITY_DN15109_c0_g1~~TRINITY_DN15109_c0_g1_i2.p1  ORF type:complete len:275 (+),score=39.48 TRINITY_DN15109_c0_g1_i2:50-874(+)